MNKKIIVIGIVALLVIVMVAVLFIYRNHIDEEVVPSEEEIVETEGAWIGVAEDTIFDGGDFEILLPQGWRGYEDLGDIFSAALITGTEEEMSEQIVWTELTVQKYARDGQSLDEYIDEIMVFLEEQKELMGEESITIRKDEERTLLDLPARYIELEVNWGEYQSVTATIFVEIEDNIWNVGINLPTADWVEGEELFERVVDSFQVK